MNAAGGTSPNPAARNLGLTAFGVLMLVTLAAEVSGWDVTAAIAAVLGTVIVAVLAIVQFVAWRRRGAKIIYIPLADDLSFTNKPEGMEITFQADLPPNALAASRCWLQRGRILRSIYPLTLMDQKPHLTRPGCMVCRHSIPTTYMPPAGPILLVAEIRLLDGTRLRRSTIMQLVDDEPSQLIPDTEGSLNE